MRLVGGERTEPAWRYALAGVLLCAGPLWRELYVNQYPARPETFVVPLAAAAAGAIVATGSRLAGGLLGTVLFGGLLFGFVDLQFDLHLSIPTAVLLAGSIGLALLLASHRATITGLALGTFYLTSFIRPGGASLTRAAATDAPRTNTPVLVHVILDEQWGVGGLRAAGDTLTADFVTDFYLKRGFELYEAAYSRYELTDWSIPNALSLGDSVTFNAVTPKTLDGRYTQSLRTNPYFAQLHKLGYEIRVFQSTFVDLCSGADVAVLSCDVQSANSIANIGFIDGSWIMRGKLLARYFLNTRSHVYAKLNPEPRIWRTAVAGGGLAAMRRLRKAILEHPQRPTAYYIHAMLPHRPVQMDAECRVLTDPSTYVGYEYPKHPSDSLWRAVVRSYSGQVRCAHRVLAQVIDAVDSTVGPERAIVIVHGDHGSRLPPRQLVKGGLQTYTVAEINSRYPTLLAIRRPHVAPVVHPEPAPIQDVIWALARSDFAGTPPTTWEHWLGRLPNSTDTGALVRPLSKQDMVWVRWPE